MQEYFRFFIILVMLGQALIFFSTTNATILNKPECDDQRRQTIERYSIKLNVFGKTGRRYPTNKKELKNFCDETWQMLNSLDKFIKECYTADVQNIAKIYIYNQKRTVKTLCAKKKTKSQKLMTFAPCINPYLPKDVCVDQLMLNIRNLIPYQMGNEKIAHTCCYFVDLLKCFDEAFSQIDCITDEMREVFLDFVRQLNGDLINFACEDYTEHSDRCSRLKPLSHYKVNNKIKIDNRFKSFLYSGITMFESITGNTTFS